MLLLSYFLIYCYIFVACSAIGSFLNVVADRLPKGETLGGRSHCENCGRILRVYELIPVFSYVFLKAKCKGCKIHISIKYLITEIVCGFVGVLSFLALGFSLKALFILLVSFVLITISLIDINTMEIPDRFIVMLAVAAVISLSFKDISLVSKIIGFFAVSLPMFILTLIIKDSFGGGDIKLMAVAGFILGWQNTLLAMFIALIIGGIYGSMLIIRKKLKDDHHLAFGPYLCCGIFVASLFGDKIITAYLSVFGL